MVTTLNFKDIIDLPKWRPLASPINFSTAGINIINVCDYRNNEDRLPLIFQFSQIIGSSTLLEIYNTKNDEWLQFINPISFFANTICGAVMMPAQGPRGTIAAGATTTSIPLSTALPGTVNINQIANRGDGRGYKVRIIGKAAGSSGKTEEKLVVANTSGTTPILTLDSPLSFTPIVGDAYEFLSGKIYADAPVANSWSAYDILTGTGLALAVQNFGVGFVTPITLVGLDELYVPYDRNPGEGFFGILTATATTGTTITGTVGATDSFIANQYRNFQIRIVEDIGTPLATGQRRNITSSAIVGGAMQYTVPAWTNNPSATAKYVIENNGDRILGWSEGSVNTFTYQIASNTWSTVLFANRPFGISTFSLGHQAFSIEPDPASNARHSMIFFLTISSSVPVLVLDIAAAATGTWTALNLLPYFPGAILSTPITTKNSSSTHDPSTNQGRYFYINVDGTQRFLRFDMKNRLLEPSTFIRVPFSATTGSSINPYYTLAYTVFVDGSTKLSFLIFTPMNSGITGLLAFGLPITR